MRILIVEDEDLQRRVLEAQVAGWGHAVSTAASGKEALCAATAADLDLLLLDVFLPDTTALELIPQLRALGVNAAIITLTGKSSRDLERRLRELGIAYYMAKPVAAVELKSILDHMGQLPRPESRRRPLSRPHPSDRPGKASGLENGAVGGYRAALQGRNSVSGGGRERGGWKRRGFRGRPT